MYDKSMPENAGKGLDLLQKNGIQKSAVLKNMTTLTQSLPDKPPARENTPSL